MMLTMGNVKYEPIRKETEDIQSIFWNLQEAALKCAHGQQKLLLRIAITWASLTSLIAVLSIAHIVLYSNNSNNRSAFATDLAALHSYVQYEKRVFDGAFNYNPDTGLAYRDFKNASEAVYFGEPGPEIDAAWADLSRASSTTACNTKSSCQANFLS